MKSCPFEQNPDYVVMYHDGAMSREMEQRFSEHLTTCRSCMEALLNLQKDLFSMGIHRLHPVPSKLAAAAEARVHGKGDTQKEAEPAGLHAGRAVFKFVRGMLNLVENLTGPKGFKEHEVPGFLQTQGQGEYRVSPVFRMEYHGVTLFLSSEGEAPFGEKLQPEKEGTFSIELRGLGERSVTLTRNGRIIEQHAGSYDESLTMKDLVCGEYELRVEGDAFIAFRVD
jgi:hypothetical protein